MYASNEPVGEDLKLSPDSNYKDELLPSLPIWITPPDLIPNQKTGLVVVYCETEG